MSFFRKQCSFQRRKFLMTFLSHFLMCLPLFTVCHLIYNIYGPFLYEKVLFQNKKFLHNTFFKSVRTFTVHASDNTTSRNMGGTDAWAVPPPQIFGGDRPPSPTLGLRPCFDTEPFVTFIYSNFLAIRCSYCFTILAPFL